MADDNILIAGLGNPGKRYELTRHNLGFLVLDYLEDRLGFSMDHKRFSSLYASKIIDDRKVHFIKPYTFMNLSGQAVSEALNFFKIDISSLIVIQDDVDLEWKRIKIKVGGGDAGHKGIRSIKDHLGTEDFVRIRIGIGRPSNPSIDTSDYVLSAFSDTEQDELENVIKSAAEAVELILKDGLKRAMNLINKSNNSDG